MTPDIVTNIVTAFVVDDEPLARSRLRALIAETPWLRHVGDAGTARAAIAAIDELRPQLVFLDVRLPGHSGLEVLQRVTHTPAVIFTTAYDQFAVTAFELGAFDYLLKPFGRERFGRAMERVRPLLHRRPQATAAARAADVLASGAVSRLFVRDGGRIVPLPIAAIDWLQACDDYVIVHVGDRAFTINLTLTALETRLDSRTFVRVHRSHMINLDRVTAIAPYDGSRFQITLRSGATLLASRQRSRTLRASLS